jgi:hypothetical protein
MGIESEQTRDFAYYYADWIWPSDSTDLMKSLLLFFDGITLALPSHLAQRVIDHDPVLAQPLYEKGLLINMEPGQWLDKKSARLLVDTLTDLVERDPLVVYHRVRNHQPIYPWWPGRMEITAAHWGMGHAQRDGRRFLQKLVRNGLVSRWNDEDSIEMDPRCRLLVLTVFLRVLDGCVRRSSNMTVQPVGSSPLRGGRHGAVNDDLLENRSMRYTRVIQDDLDRVLPDLSKIPLDEVLDFRREQGSHYRAYTQSLRGFFLASAHMDDAEFKHAVKRRAEAVGDELADLRRRSRIAFGRTSFGLAVALAGATWTVVQGDPLGAALAALGSIAGMQSSQVTVSDYSYLFQTRTLQK